MLSAPQAVVLVGVHAVFGAVRHGWSHDEFKYYMSDKPSLKVQIDEPEAACGMPLAEPGLPPSPSMEQHDEVGAPKMLLAPQVVVPVPLLEQPHG